MTALLRDDPNADAIVNVYLGASFGKATFTRGWKADGSKFGLARGGAGASPSTTDNLWRRVESWVAGIRVYSLLADAIAAPVVLRGDTELARDGAGLAGVLTRLRDREDARFEALNDELASWLPEFEQVCLDTDNEGRRVFYLRTREGHHAIRAVDLSQGTLLALAILTLAHLPDPPSLIGLEEPDRGIHPHLLRHVQDAIHRLSHPESCGEKREPVQVIATTHSPYFLDLFKDHPEEIVIANKVGLDVQFQRLSEQPHIQEILGDAPLGEIWYTGILGGVPANS
jgi:predicted ATPase